MTILTFLWMLIALIGIVLMVEGILVYNTILTLLGIFMAGVGLGILVVSMGWIDEPSRCEKHGTVIVVVDGDEYCVPWEQAPNLQDFSQP